MNCPLSLNDLQFGASGVVCAKCGQERHTWYARRLVRAAHWGMTRLSGLQHVAEGLRIRQWSDSQLAHRQGRSGFIEVRCGSLIGATQTFLISMSNSFHWDYLPKWRSSSLS